MVLRSCGYLSGCKRDCNGKTGLTEKYGIKYRNNHQYVSLLCSLDANGRMVAPAYNDISNGFIPLRDRVAQGGVLPDEMGKFVRSNKPTYSKFGEFAVIVEAELDFSMSDGKLLESGCTVSLFAPKGFMSGVAGLDYAVVCDMLSDKPGLNMMVVDPKLLAAYRGNFLGALTMVGTRGKEAYLLGRVGYHAGEVV